MVEDTEELPDDELDALVAELARLDALLPKPKPPRDTRP